MQVERHTVGSKHEKDIEAELDSNLAEKRCAARAVTSHFHALVTAFTVVVRVCGGALDPSGDVED